MENKGGDGKERVKKEEREKRGERKKDKNGGKDIFYEEEWVMRRHRYRYLAVSLAYRTIRMEERRLNEQKNRGL